MLRDLEPKYWFLFVCQVCEGGGVQGFNLTSVFVWFALQHPLVSSKGKRVSGWVGILYEVEPTRRMPCFLPRERRASSWWVKGGFMAGLGF